MPEPVVLGGDPANPGATTEPTSQPSNGSQTQDNPAETSPAPEEGGELFQKYNSREEIQKLPEDHYLRQTLKSMDRDYTQKTMALAEDRKQTESLKQFKPLIDGLQANPEATLRALVAQYPQVLQTQQAAPDPLAKVKEIVPEEEVSALQTLVDQATKPLKDEIAALNNQIQLTRFGTENPDYKTREEKLAQLTRMFVPANGQVTQEYLTALDKSARYDEEIANRDKIVADRVQAELSKLNKVPQSSEAPTASPSDSQVAPMLPETNSETERALAAFRLAVEGKTAARPPRKFWKPAS